jgi:hypothetical protein
MIRQQNTLLPSLLIPSSFREFTTTGGAAVIFLLCFFFFFVGWILGVDVGVSFCSRLGAIYVSEKKKHFPPISSRTAEIKL